MTPAQISYFISVLRAKKLGRTIVTWVGNGGWSLSLLKLAFVCQDKIWRVCHESFLGRHDDNKIIITILPRYWANLKNIYFLQSLTSKFVFTDKKQG